MTTVAMMTHDKEESWIMNPVWQWIVGTCIVVLFGIAIAIPVTLVVQEQTRRANGIERSATAVVCGLSSYVDELTKPVPLNTTDPATIERIKATNVQRATGRELFREKMPEKYLSKCELAE